MEAARVACSPGHAGGQWEAPGAQPAEAKDAHDLGPCQLSPVFLLWPPRSALFVCLVFSPLLIRRALVSTKNMATCVRNHAASNSGGRHRSFLKCAPHRCERLVSPLSPVSSRPGGGGGRNPPGQGASPTGSIRRVLVLGSWGGHVREMTWVPRRRSWTGWPSPCGSPELTPQPPCGGGVRKRASKRSCAAENPSWDEAGAAPDSWLFILCAVRGRSHTSP